MAWQHGSSILKLFLIVQFANLPRNPILEMICEVSVIEVNGEIVAGVFPPAVVQVSLVQES